MSETYQKTEIAGVYRDQESGAFVNTDIHALEGYKKRKKVNRMTRQMDTRLSHVENRLDQVYEMLNDIVKKIEDTNKNS